MKKILSLIILFAMLIGFIIPTNDASAATNCKSIIVDLNSSKNSSCKKQLEKLLSGTSSKKKGINADIGIIVNGKPMIPLNEIYKDLGISKSTLKKKIKGEKKISGKKYLPIDYYKTATKGLIGWDSKEMFGIISTSKVDIFVKMRPYFKINGTGFVYDGDLVKGKPHGFGTGVKGTSIYGKSIYYEGIWKNGKPVSIFSSLRSLETKFNTASEPYFKNYSVNFTKFTAKNADVEDSYFSYPINNNVLIQGEIQPDGSLRYVTVSIPTELVNNSEEAAYDYVVPANILMDTFGIDPVVVWTALENGVQTDEGIVEYLDENAGKVIAQYADQDIMTLGFFDLDDYEAGIE